MTVTHITRRTQLYAGVAAAVALVLTGCTGAPEASPPETMAEGTTEAAHFPVEIASCGHTTTLDAAPTKALTLNQGATEVMLALGLEGSMVGTAYLDDAVAPEWQAAFDSVPVLSDEYPSHEAILATESDFIYASYGSAFEAEVAGTQEELAAAGISSYLSPFGCNDRELRPQASFDAVWDEISTVADAFGVPERAAEVRQSQEATLESIATAGDGLSVLWWDSGTDAPFVGAGTGAPQLVIDAVGATNIFGDLDGNWADGNWEDVLAADPDVIVLIDASWDTADDKKTHLKGDPVLSQLTAVQNEAYAVLPFSESTAGVRLVYGAKSLADQISALPSDS